MRVLEWEQFLEEGLSRGQRAAMTVGVFDGVHRGHRALIEQIVRRKDMVPVIITFRQNHQKAEGFWSAGKSRAGAVSSFRQKTALFEELGVKAVVVAELTDTFRNMTGAEFLCILREKGRMGFLALGSNFRCGRGQDTDAEKIRAINAEYNIPTELVSILIKDSLPVSSSRIREAIAAGKLADAKAMLGRPFVLDLAEGKSGQSGKERVLDMRGAGLVLPPSGTYKALLYSAKEKTRAEITLANGVLTIPGSADFSFVEFL